MNIVEGSWNKSFKNVNVSSSIFYPPRVIIYMKVREAYSSDVKHNL